VNVYGEAACGAAGPVMQAPGRGGSRGEDGGTSCPTACGGSYGGGAGGSASHVTDVVGGQGACRIVSTDSYSGFPYSVPILPPSSPLPSPTPGGSPTPGDTPVPGGTPVPGESPTPGGSPVPGESSNTHRQSGVAGHACCAAFMFCVHAANLNSCLLPSAGLGLCYSTPVYHQYLPPPTDKADS
jgi:hypothetical protein